MTSRDAGFLVGVLALLPFAFLATLNQDRLVRLLYDKYRSDWDQAGSPIGFFWRPPGGLPATSALAFTIAAMTWAFRLPPPLRSDPAARRPLILLRAGLLVWNAGMITLFAVFVARHGFPPRI